MIVYYDATGAIVCKIEAATDSGTYPKNPGTPLYLDDATYADVWANPGRYLIVADAPARQPYIALTTATDATTTPPTVTVTATLTGGNATSVTFTIGTSAQDVPLSNGAASIALRPHASVASLSLSVDASATGAVGDAVDVGTPGGDTFALQLVPPTSGGTYIIAPSGPGSKAFLRAWALGMDAEMQVEVLTESLQNLAVAVQVTNHMLLTKIIPALQSASYTPVDLSAEAAALSNWNTNVIPHFTGLADLLDASGNPIAQYAELQAQAPQVATAQQAYAQAYAEIPNLQ